MPTQKNFDWLLIFLNLYQHVKNQFIPSLYSLDTVNFRVPSLDWPHPSLTMLTPKICNQLLICVNLYQYTKTQLIPLLILEIKKTLQSDWLRAFWPLSQEQGFSQICIGFVQEYIKQYKFHYRTNSVKIKDQLFV